VTQLQTTSVLFVCLGNICRSPLAEGIFRSVVERADLSDRFDIDSAGTGSWHVGNPPHPGSIAVAHAHGVDISDQRSRQLRPSDLERFDWIVAMDQSNMRNIRRLTPEGDGAQLLRLLDGVPDGPDDVPDPYYEGGFDRVYDLVEAGCRALLTKLYPED
jgi:protein-tyrosine phosphatase